MPNNPEKFIEVNSPDGALKHTLQGKDFLQSMEWRIFQEKVGRKNYNISNDHFCANIIEHELPIVGKYFYVPRGPVIPAQAGIQSLKLDSGSEAGMTRLLNLAKENNAGWIRIEPAKEEILETIKSWTRNVHNGHFVSIKKAPHDMQSKEIFVIDITKPEDQLLQEMKSKTRYNIRLAEKKGVKTWSMEHGAWNKKYVEEFLRLTKIMAERQGIAVHPDEYYRKMLETIPGDILKLYVAEYENKIITANIVIHYGNTATYLHGASDDKYKNLMAPYLLQWKQIQDASSAGCTKYDFGGVKTQIMEHGTWNMPTGEAGDKNSWSGITRFKIGFSPKTKPTEFSGSYDIILNRKKYYLYRAIQKIKSIIR